MVVFTSCGDGWKKYIPLSVDKELGILDWVGIKLSEEDIIRFDNHYK